MEKFSLYDLCVIAKSLQVDFSKLTYEQGEKYYIPNLAGRNEADMTQRALSEIEYYRISILIRVLQEILNYRPLPL